jgi:hypothetical protein
MNMGFGRCFGERNCPNRPLHRFGSLHVRSKQNPPKTFSTMTINPPLWPPAAAATLHTRHFRRRRNSLMDALLDHNCTATPPSTAHAVSFHRDDFSRRGLFSRLHCLPGCPKLHQCVLDAIGMWVAASGLALMCTITTKRHWQRSSVEWLFFPKQSALLFTVVTTITICIGNKGNERNSFCRMG